MREWRLSEQETRALGNLPLPVDLARVRVHRGGGGSWARALRGFVLGLSRGRGIALGNHVFLPDECRESLPVLAHEVTHCGQYQAWGAIRYYWRGVADRVRELGSRRGLTASPYHYDAETPKPFEAYGMEQQGQIVEDWFRGSPRARKLLTPAAGDPPTGRTHSHPGQRSSP